MAMTGTEKRAVQEAVEFEGKILYIAALSGVSTNQDIEGIEIKVKEMGQASSALVVDIAEELRHRLIHSSDSLETAIAKMQIKYGVPKAGEPDA